MTRRSWGRVALVATLTLAGCGGGARPDVSGARAAGSLPACVKAGDALARPEGFPVSLPLPDGTLITAHDNGVKRVALSGYVPMPLRDAAAWMSRQLPSAGYRNGEGDAEQDEAESVFTGHGYQGKWKLNALDACAGAVAIQVSLSPLD